MGQFSVEKPGLPGSVLSGNQQGASRSFFRRYQLQMPDRVKEDFYTIRESMILNHASDQPGTSRKSSSMAMRKMRFPNLFKYRPPRNNLATRRRVQSFEHFPLPVTPRSARWRGYQLVAQFKGRLMLKHDILGHVSNRRLSSRRSRWSSLC